MSFIDELRQKLPISGSDSGSELFDLHLGLRTACAEVDRLRAENAKLVDLCDAVGKLKDANVTGAVERAYAAASEVKETKP